MLQNFKSMCEKKQAIIVSKDKGEGRIHRAFNTDKDTVRQYQIDGYVINSQTLNKCDFLLMNDIKKKAYLIEVKGKKLLDALKQLDSTEQLLQNDLKGYEKNFRIVYRPNTHDIHSTDYKKFYLKHKGLVVAKTNLLEESI